MTDKRSEGEAKRSGTIMPLRRVVGNGVAWKLWRQQAKGGGRTEEDKTEEAKAAGDVRLWASGNGSGAWRAVVFLRELGHWGGVMA